MALTPTTTFATADDGARLAARLIGAGSPLLCVPGGPLLDAAYLGDLGDLSSHRRLVLLDPRGSGASDRTDDPISYRCDHLVADIEAVRRHLGLDAIDLFAHSAGANLAYRYAEHHPDRIGRLVLVTPSVFALGLPVPNAARREIALLRQNESWYPEAAAALASIQDGTATENDWAAITPFTYGRWNKATQAYDASMEARRNPDAAAAFVADGAFDPPATRAALAVLDAPVLVVAGSWDVGNPPRVMAQVADLFPRGRLIVQPEAGHFPWVDTPMDSARRSTPSWPRDPAWSANGWTSEARCQRWQFGDPLAAISDANLANSRATAHCTGRRSLCGTVWIEATTTWACAAAAHSRS